MPDEREVRPLLASDMDGTLVPPDRAPERLEALRAFREAVASAGLQVVYVTGRHLALAQKGIEDLGLPEPVGLSCDVGTTVYWLRSGAFRADSEYRESLASLPGVAPAAAVREALSDVSGVTLQEAEKQSDFKVSYYLDDGLVDGGLPLDLEATLTARLDPVGRTRQVVSHDPVTGRGLLDVLPADVGKGTAVAYMVRHLGVAEGRAVFAGDSGNDRDALVSGMPAVVVGNAPAELISDVQATAGMLGFADKVYVAGADFCEGVSEGLRHFGLLPARR